LDLQPYLLNPLMGWIGNCLWWGKDSASNKAIYILDFEIGDQLPLPSDVVVTTQFGGDTVIQIVEVGSRRKNWCG
jgi:hypothetical protein